MSNGVREIKCKLCAGKQGTNYIYLYFHLILTDFCFKISRICDHHALAFRTSWSLVEADGMLVSEMSFLDFSFSYITNTSNSWYLAHGKGVHMLDVKLMGKCWSDWLHKPKLVWAGHHWWVSDIPLVRITGWHHPVSTFFIFNYTSIVFYI